MLNKFSFFSSRKCCKTSWVVMFIIISLLFLTDDRVREEEKPLVLIRIVVFYLWFIYPGTVGLKSM